MSQLGSEYSTTEKEFMKGSKAKLWCEWQRGLDELKEKEERDELGRERKRKKMRKKSTMFALALREMRRKKDIYFGCFGIEMA